MPLKPRMASERGRPQAHLLRAHNGAGAADHALAGLHPRVVLARDHSMLLTCRHVQRPRPATICGSGVCFSYRWEAPCVSDQEIPHGLVSASCSQTSGPALHMEGHINVPHHAPPSCFHPCFCSSGWPTTKRMPTQTPLKIQTSKFRPASLLVCALRQDGSGSCLSLSRTR